MDYKAGQTKQKQSLEYQKDKVEEVVLALLYLNEIKAGSAWKGFDWEATDRLHEKGHISNPRSKNKSVAFSEEGFALAGKLFEKHFK